MLDRAAELRDRVLRVGARAADRPDERLRKQLLILISLGITVLATLWVVAYVVLGRPISAAIPFSYQILSVASLVYLARTGNFAVLRFAQLASMMLLPFLLQWTLGGFVHSSAVMLWAFAAPLGALLFYGPRAAAAWFAAFIGLTAASGLVDRTVAALTTPLPPAIELLFFVLNIGGMSLVVFAVLLFFVAERNRAQAETDALLHNILPVEIADRLRAGEQQIADDFEAVTLLFADVVGFTAFARTAPAREVVSLLERLFSAFDELADRYGLEKIKTIGDAYMAVAGAPRPMDGHVRAAADMALAMIEAAEQVAHESGRDIKLRVGIHTGQANAGVIGRRKFFYDVWGDAVNVASRMETTGMPGRVHVSAAVEAALRGEYLFEQRDTIEIKGVGPMTTYFLVGPAR